MTADARGTTELIAIVDDDGMVRRSLGRVLRSAGYKVVSYASGVLLLAAVAECKPACNVLDFNMPELNGHAVQAALTERGHRIPVIVITAEPDPQILHKAAALGAVHCLPKPVHSELLLQTIAAVFRQGKPPPAFATTTPLQLT